jgi:hypothetical protein
MAADADGVAGKAQSFRVRNDHLAIFRDAVRQDRLGIGIKRRGDSTATPRRLGAEARVEMIKARIH